jgi:LmbE family N-acetylglucosaminyl deacetylase
VLVVAPHPDDETLGCGGTLVLLARARVNLHIAFVTDGEASHPSHPVYSPAEIAVLRRNEAQEASAALGVNWRRTAFLGAPDGKLASLDAGTAEETVARMAKELLETEPDAVLLPCRDDGSSDHGAAYGLVGEALKRSGRRPRMLEFPIWAWRNPLLLLKLVAASRCVWRVDLGDARKSKLEAIQRYASQTLPIPPDREPVLPPEFTSEFMDSSEYYFEK